jgi:glycosyltransferase involved in cell wall biosynthesis/SAM-dependent methyltransferase
MLQFTGERIVPEADNCEPRFAEKMYQEHSARYRFAAAIAPGARVLDVGCGVGYGARLLAEAGAAEVLAFDLSEEAIAHARANYGHPSIVFRQGDATNFQFEGAFDLVTCFELIEHVHDQEGVFRSIVGALAPHGVVVMSTPRALAEKRTHFHTREYSLGEFTAAFDRHFARHRMWVENNHFASLITEGSPQALKSVVAMNDQFSAAAADYFIVAATQGPARLLGRFAPTLVLNNDRYVTLLEHDVEVLQCRRIDLEGDVAALREREGVLERDVGVLKKGCADLELRLERERAQAQAEGAAWAERVRELEARHAELESAHAEALAHSWRLEHSLTWRWTRWLRWLGAVVERWAPISRVAEHWRLHGGRSMRRNLLRLLAGPSANRPPLSVAPASEVPATAEPTSPAPPDVLILIGCWDGESKRYRAFNLAEALRAQGHCVELWHFSALARIAAEDIRPKVVVIFRAPEVPEIDALLAHAERHGTLTVFDVDDLVFVPEVVPQIHGYQTLSPSEQAQYRHDVERYRALLKRCRLVTTTTAALARAAESIGATAKVVPNTWNDIQFDIAERLIAAPAPERQGLTITYFSGSRTHDRDFAEAAPALSELLASRSDVRLLIVGPLNLGQEFTPLAAQIERRDFVPYQKMLEVLRETDINIAPLELNNAFNEAKSELKIFEAALMGVPTVASATEPYRNAIETGVDGFVATTTDDWRKALAVLCDNADLRRVMGAKARERSLRDFGPERLAAAAEAVYALPKPRSRRVRDRGSKRIDWIVPGLIIGGGGHRNILRAAHYLERFGHDVGLHFTDTNLSAKELQAQLHAHFYPFEGEVRSHDGIFRASDALIATHWTTVAPALAAAGQTREVMYFVQDFEPLFAPMGTEYILAENTYRKGLYCITSGKWCEQILRRDFGAEADHFEFPIDRTVYHPRPRRKDNVNVVFFAKPEMPRRCYDLGVMMLRHLHRIAPEVEIVMFGSPHVNVSELGFPATVCALVPTLFGLAQIYADADVGVVFSTTNPSLVPYEMMACGTPVVDLARPGNEANYDGRDDIALLADPDPLRMAQQVLTLLRDPEDRARRRRASLDFVARLPTEEQAARRIEELIVKRLAR